MIRRHVAALRSLLMAADLVTSIALFLTIAAVRFRTEEWRALWGDTRVDVPVAAAFYGVAWVSVLWLRGLYRLRARLSPAREAADIIAAAAVFAVATFAFLFLAKLPDVSRLFLLLLFPAQAALTLTSRLLLRVAFARVRSLGRNARFVLVVGTGSQAQEFADRIESHPELGLRVIGHLAEPVAASAGPDHMIPRRPVLGQLEDLERVLHREVVDEVAVCLPVSAWNLIEPITVICADVGKIVRIPMDAAGLAIPRGHVEDFDGSPVLSLVQGPDRELALLLKRVVDLVLAAVLAVVLSPLMLAIAVTIRVRDGSPVLFGQERVGLHGRPFRLLKFRTMVVGAEEHVDELQAHNEITGRAFKMTDDPRLSRSGPLLRRLSLDELPQLWNVLKGEMSLVGPRPPLPAEVAGYDLWHRRRLSMKPGITGLWQVKARREREFDRWVEMDLDYIDRWSLWLDLQIMLRTIPAIIGQHGR